MKRGCASWCWNLPPWRLGLGCLKDKFTCGQIQQKLFWIILKVAICLFIYLLFIYVLLIVATQWNVSLFRNLIPSLDYWEMKMREEKWKLKRVLTVKFNFIIQYLVFCFVWLFYFHNFLIIYFPLIYLYVCLLLFCFKIFISLNRGAQSPIQTN